jgi:hypothetical protein
MEKSTIEIERIRAGQPRPHTDCVYEAIYTFSGGYRGMWEPTRETVLKYVKAGYYDGFYAGEGQQQPGQAYLKELEQLTKSKWRAVIVEPYMD